MSKFIIPEAPLMRHIAVLGETGSGKTHDLKVVVEHLVSENFRVCILDTIKSDWWGMISSATGKSAGLPFRILGGPRGHVPLHAGAGHAIGELVAKGALPLSIIDMADFKPGGPQQFFEEFAEALWRHMKGVLYLVIEEAHELAPKERAGFGKENMAVYWAKKLGTGSRTKGIRLIIASQRTQAVHNALLGSCGTMMAHSLSLPADQKPVIEWLDANVRDKALKGTIENELAFLPTGTAWVCCAKEQFFEKIKFPRIKTFDNTATPDKDAADFDVKTTPVDADELRAIIGDAVKEAEANDPASLRKEIARLNKALAEAPTKKLPVAQGPTQRREDAATIRAQAEQIKVLRGAVEAAMKIIVEISAEDFFKAGGPAVDKAEVEKAISAAMGRVTSLVEANLKRRSGELDSLRRQAGRVLRQLKAVMEQDQDVIVKVNVKHHEPFTVSAKAHPQTSPRQDGSEVSQVNGSLSGPQQRIVDALAWWEAAGEPKPSRVQVAVVARYSARSSSFTNPLSALKTAGFIGYPSPGSIVLTDEGRTLANAPDAAPTPDELHRRVEQILSGPEWRILKPLIEAYPESLTREELAQRSNYSPDSSSFTNPLSGLRSLGLINYRSGGLVEALSILFPY